MKKFTVYASLFAFAFALAVGTVITMPDRALATEECVWECLGYTECHYDETGPLCMSNPRTPYYLYFRPTCEQGPLNCPDAPYWVGCCAKLNPL